MGTDDGEIKVLKVNPGTVQTMVSMRALYLCYTLQEHGDGALFFMQHEASVTH